MISDYIVVIRQPTDKESGLRLRQKTYHPDAFSTHLDVSHVILEEYKGSLKLSTKGETIVSTYTFNTEDIPALIKGFGQFKEYRQNKVVSVKLVTDMNEYKGSK